MQECRAEAVYMVLRVVTVGRMVKQFSLEKDDRADYLSKCLHDARVWARIAVRTSLQQPGKSGCL